VLGKIHFDDINLINHTEDPKLEKSVKTKLSKVASSKGVLLSPELNNLFFTPFVDSGTDYF